MPLNPPDVLSILPPPFAWCEIPYGKVELEVGSWQNFQYVIERKLKVHTGASFFIAQYPITNAQYKVFLDAPDGYTNLQWWKSQRPFPALESRLAYPQSVDIPRDNDKPATHVSFYDALAFCGWLSIRLRDWLRPLTLPYEQHWQRAAQGDDARVYLWGNEFEVKRANTRESNIIKTTPVTQHPQGVSPFGVMDMSGNVWEWCMGEVDSFHILRGGSWRFNAKFATSTYRCYCEPDQVQDNIGFRIMVHQALE